MILFKRSSQQDTETYIEPISARLRYVKVRPATQIRKVQKRPAVPPFVRTIPRPLGDISG